MESEWMAGFDNYLRNDSPKPLLPSSIRQATTSIRRLELHTHERERTDPWTLSAYRESLPPSTKNLFGWAWRMYRTFVQREKGVELPEVKAGAQVKLPHPVWPYLIDLGAVRPWASLESLTVAWAEKSGIPAELGRPVFEFFAGRTPGPNDWLLPSPVDPTLPMRAWMIEHLARTGDRMGDGPGPKLVGTAYSVAANRGVTAEQLHELERAFGAARRELHQREGVKSVANALVLESRDMPWSVSHGPLLGWICHEIRTYALSRTASYVAPDPEAPPTPTPTAIHVEHRSDWSGTVRVGPEIPARDRPAWYVPQITPPTPPPTRTGYRAMLSGGRIDSEPGDEDSAEV